MSRNNRLGPPEDRERLPVTKEGGALIRNDYGTFSVSVSSGDLTDLVCLRGDPLGTCYTAVPDEDHLGVVFQPARGAVHLPLKRSKALLICLFGYYNKRTRTTRAEAITPDVRPPLEYNGEDTVMQRPAF